MNRLQKKCLIAVAGTHLFLIVLLFCSGFIRPAPKADDVQFLDVIPATAIDAAFKSGMKGAQPPPTPVTPVPTFVQKVEHLFKPEPDRLPPDDLKPVDNSETKPKPPRHEVKPDLTTVERATPKNSPSQKADSQQKQQQRSNAFKQAVNNLEKKFSSATEIEMPGASSASYANYGAIVVSVYHHGWVPPENMASDTAVVKFSVTIARDGTVISAHIVTSSGDTSVDNAVRRMLDRVTFIHEFPDDTKDRERNYEIDFNATRTNIQ